MILLYDWRIVLVGIEVELLEARREACEHALVQAWWRAQHRGPGQPPTSVPGRPIPRAVVPYVHVY